MRVEMTNYRGNADGDPSSVHHRRSIRLRGHDYARPGLYFVTLCTADRRPLFGTVVNGRMALNDAGRAAAACWREIPCHFPNTALDEWIVMPDHLHGILRIATRSERAKWANDHSETGANDHSPLPHGTTGTLGSIVRGFKIGVTRHLGGVSPWHRNFYDIIIRDAAALANIRAYIRDNPTNWDVARYGEPRFTLGDTALLRLPTTAFLASRGPAAGVRAKGTWANDHSPLPACVISGFLSPMERAVFDACLADGTPMVWVLASGLPAALPPPVRRAVDAGRLLLLTPFDDTVAGPSAQRAAWCNQFVLHLAQEVVVGHLTPDGMLACLLTDLRQDKPVHILTNAGEGE